MIIKFVWLVLVSCLIACTSTPSSSVYSPTPALVAEMSWDTAALAIPGGAIYCSAVWIDADKLLTAAHCVRTMQRMQLFGLPPMFRATETSEPEEAGAVLRYDVEHDVALLEAKTVHLHGVAELARFTPPKGAELHVVGHPGGMGWTYCHGYVGSYLSVDAFGNKPGSVGPWLQVSAPIFKGHSGAAIFDANGDIVGIMSGASEQIPDYGVAVHLDTLRHFLQ